MISAIKTVSFESSDSESDHETMHEGTSSQSRCSVGIFDVNLAEINEELTPLVYLLEASKSLELLKHNLRPVIEIEKEFLSVMKSQKLGIDKVFSCSHTLDLLLRKFTETTDQNEKLTLKAEETDKNLFLLQQQLTEERSISSYLRKQNQTLLTRLQSVSEDKKRLDQRVEYLEGRQFE